MAAAMGGAYGIQRRRGETWSLSAGLHLTPHDAQVVHDQAEFRAILVADRSRGGCYAERTAAM